MISNVKQSEYAEMSEIAEYSEYNPLIQHSEDSDNSTISEYSENSEYSAYSDSQAHAIAMRHIPIDRRGVDRAVFSLARELRALLPNASVADLGPYVEVWNKVALKDIAGFDQTMVWWTFIDKWDAVKFPDGEDPLSLIVKSLADSEPPACAMRYGEKVRRFVHILQRLQMEVGDKSFYMSERTAAKLMETTQPMARTCLKRLVNEGVLEVDHKVKANQYRATRYRYIGG